MIIDFSVNCNNYGEKIFNNYLFFDYICPTCGARHSFTRHACYERNICLMDNCDNIHEEKMMILRLLCGSCGSTHAVLPNDVVPYCIYSYSFIMNVLIKYFIENKKIVDICEACSISFQLIYSFVSKFTEFLNSSFSVLKTMGYDIPCTPEKVLLNITSINEKTNFSLTYFINTRWMFLMTKFHNILPSPVWLGYFFE